MASCLVTPFIFFFLVPSFKQQKRRCSNILPFSEFLIFFYFLFRKLQNGGENGQEGRQRPAQAHWLEKKKNFFFFSTKRGLETRFMQNGGEG